MGGRQRRDYYFQMYYVEGTMCLLWGNKNQETVRKEEEKEWRKNSTILGVK